MRDIGSGRRWIVTVLRNERWQVFTGDAVDTANYRDRLMDVQDVTYIIRGKVKERYVSAEE